MGELEGGAVDDAQTLAMMTDELMAKFDQLVELEPAVEGYGPYGPWILLTRGTLIVWWSPAVSSLEGALYFMDFMLTCAIPMTHNDEGCVPTSPLGRGLVTYRLHSPCS